MALLRKTLYIQAAVWAVSGLALAALPRFVLTDLMHQVHYPEYAWVRIVGVEAFALGMLMVLVAHRVEELWWWSWAFLIPTALIALVALLNAAFGLPKGSSSVMWWATGGVSVVFGVSLTLGLGRAGQERPII